MDFTGLEKLRASAIWHAFADRRLTIEFARPYLVSANFSTSNVKRTFSQLVIAHSRDPLGHIRSHTWMHINMNKFYFGRAIETIDSTILIDPITPSIIDISKFVQSKWLYLIGEMHSPYFFRSNIVPHTATRTGCFRIIELFPNFLIKVKI